MAQASPALLTSLLKQVSRSFYLTLRILPAAIRPQIGTAYLLARATDTIADTEIVPLAKRLEALGALRERILGQRTSPLNFEEIAHGGQQQEPIPHSNQPTPAEQLLLEQIEPIVLLLDGFSSADQQRIREVLRTIISGQSLDLERFALANATQVVALQTGQELEDYTHRVAGCVGE